MFMILVVGLLAGGRVKFTFFPTPEGQVVYANATFVSAARPGQGGRTFPAPPGNKSGRD
jgi:hypothetical protein